MRNRTDELRAQNDARRSYLFEGGRGAGRLADLLDPDFDEIPMYANGEPMDLVDFFKIREIA